MNRKTTFEDDPRLVKAAATLFPRSWAKALAAAGIDPATARAEGWATRRLKAREAPV